MSLTAKKILLVEDDDIYTIWIKIVLEEASFLNFSSVKTVEDALNECATAPPDLIISDIFLEGKLTGIDLVKKLQGYNIPVIIITNSKDKELYKKINSIQQVNYLVKPFQALSLISSIENIFYDIENNKASKYNRPYILIKNFENVYEKIFLDDVLYIEVERNYTFLYTRKRKLALKKSLASFQENLNEAFIRVHKSFLVNSFHIKALSSHHIVLSNDIRIDIGRSYVKELKKSLAITY